MAPGPARPAMRSTGSTAFTRRGEAVSPGSRIPAPALDALAERAETVVVKLGADGAIPAGAETRRQADAVARAVVDTTGAAVATAGFLCALAQAKP